MATRRFLIIKTGGTIAGNVAGYEASARLYTEPCPKSAPAPDPFDAALRHALLPLAADIKGDWNVDVQVEFDRVANEDSSNIRPDHWTAMAEMIAQSYDVFDGFIVLHGTNTLAYTSAALAFALPNIAKPVVITGSQVAYGRAASDAPLNIANALRVAAYPHLGGVRGIVCVFGSFVITGTRAKKATEFALDAFIPFAAGELGRIGRHIRINESNLQRHHGYLFRESPTAATAQDLVVQAAFDMNLISLSEFPGMNPVALRSMLAGLIDTCGGLKGVIFRAFGAGDVADCLHPCFEFLSEHRVPVVVTTQAPQGTSTLRINDPGQKLKERGLAIPAHDMSIEAMTTKLGWLVAQGYSYDQIRDRMETDLHGEISRSPDLI